MTLVWLRHSFGTIVEVGAGAITLFRVLQEIKTPFVYAGGDQKDALPADVRALLDEAEETGLAIAPNWLDQIGVLSHPVC